MAGSRPLARGVEKAFGFEALLELLEGKLQRARADGLHGFGNELQLAALFVDADAAANEDVQAVFRPETEQHGLAAKEHDGKLRVGVLQREVDVAGWGGTEVGDFAFDPDVDVLLLNQFADLADELADRPDAAGGARLFKYEIELRQILGRGKACYRKFKCWTDEAMWHLCVIWLW